MSFPRDFDLSQINENFLNSMESPSPDSSNLYKIFNLAIRNEEYWAQAPLDLKQRMVQIVENKIGKESFSNNFDSVFFITKDLFQSKLEHVIAPEIFEFIRGNKKIYELSNENLISLLSLTKIFKIENLDMIEQLNSITSDKINEENLSSLLKVAQNYKSIDLLRACCDFLNDKIGGNSDIYFVLNDEGDNLVVSLLKNRQLSLNEKNIEGIKTLEEGLLNYKDHFLIRDVLKNFERISDKYFKQLEKKPEIHLDLDLTVYLKENTESVNKFLCKYLDSVTSVGIDNKDLNKFFEKLNPEMWDFDPNNSEHNFARKKFLAELVLPDINVLKNLKALGIKYCQKIEDINFKELTALKDIYIKGVSDLHEEEERYWILDAVNQEQIEKLVVAEGRGVGLNDKLKPLKNLKTLNLSGGFLSLNTSAEHIYLVECEQLKNLVAPNVKSLVIHKNQVFENLNTSAKNVNLEGCRKLKTLNAPEAKTLIIKDSPLEKLDTLAENVTLEGCRKLKTLNAPEAKSLIIKDSPLEKLDTLAENVNLEGCTFLDKLEAPNAEKLFIVDAPRLKTIKAPLAQEGCLEKCPVIEDIEVSFALPDYLILALSKLLKSYEIKSIKSETEAESAIPEVPELQVRLNDIEFKSFQILEELKNQLMAIDESITVLKCGGDIYTKHDLLQAIEQIISFVKDSSQDINFRKKIYFLLSECIEKLTENPDKSGLIRLSVDYRNGGINLLEKTLELLYRLEIIKTMFYEINFDKPDEPGYVSPETLRNELINDGMGSVTLEMLQGSFNKLLDRIKRQETFMGTPKENAADGHKQLKKYYHNLEQYFQLVVNGLEKEHDLEKKASYLMDIALASLHCGERWIGDSQQVYSFLTENEGSASETTLEDLIKKADTKFKLGIIEKLSYDKFNVVNVHIYDQYKRLIGMEIGIPGSEVFVDIGDDFSDPFLTKEIALDNFYLEYTLNSIVTYQKGQLEEFFEKKVRDILVSVLLENMPSEWVEKEYGEVLNGLDSLIERKADRDEIRSFLKGEGIIIRPDWTAENALNVYIQEMQDSADFMDLEEQDQEIRLNKMEELRNELKKLSIDEQKKMLRKEGIPLGREFNPDFKAELFLNYINTDYLGSIFIKNKETGEPTKQLDLQAVLPTILFLLEKIGKIGKKAVL